MAETAIKAPLSIVKKLFEKRSSNDENNGDFGVKAYFEEIYKQSPPNMVREETDHSALESWASKRLLLSY